MIDPCGSVYQFRCYPFSYKSTKIMLMQPWIYLIDAKFMSSLVVSVSFLFPSNWEFSRYRQNTHTCWFHQLKIIQNNHLIIILSWWNQLVCVFCWYPDNSRKQKRNGRRYWIIKLSFVSQKPIPTTCSSIVYNLY